MWENREQLVRKIIFLETKAHFLMTLDIIPENTGNFSTQRNVQEKEENESDDGKKN